MPVQILFLVVFALMGISIPIGMFGFLDDNKHLKKTFLKIGIALILCIVWIVLGVSRIHEIANQPDGKNVEVFKIYRIGDIQCIKIGGRVINLNAKLERVFDPQDKIEITEPKSTWGYGIWFGGSSQYRKYKVIKEK